MRLALALSIPLSFVSLAACGNDPNNVLVTLAPDVVSSLDGVASVRAVVMSDAEPLPETAVTVTVAYTDRGGAAHEIAPLTGVTDERGAFAGDITGLTWDGTGLVTVSVDGAPTIAGEAPFAVIDRTPPQVSITAPTLTRHVVQGQDFRVPVHVQDEIGVSEIWLEAAGELDRLRSTVVASGSADATVEFELSVPDGAAPGGTITLYALAGDLSGNQAAAEPIMLTVDAAP